jgi:hypothetical protein
LSGDFRFEHVERALLDRQNERVEIGEHVVDRPQRAADVLRDIPRAQRLNSHARR